MQKEGNLTMRAADYSERWEFEADVETKLKNGWIVVSRSTCKVGETDVLDEIVISNPNAQRIHE
jgi:hypothetical protein